MHAHQLPAAAGSPLPLGATTDADGTNFAIHSGPATRIELVLFDDDGERVLPLADRLGDTWSVHVSGVGHGQRYGYRVDGPHKPEEGHRFDASLLLVDPYARAVEPAPPGAGGRYVGVVVDEPFDWGDDRPPRTPLLQSVFYETHVRGYTKLHPGVPEELRGTYRGLAERAVVDGLVALGVTAVELQPVQEFHTETVIADRGLVNYWGYMPFAWFAPHGAYATGTRGEQVREFKEMVKALHAAGLEVIVDVVYNHTAEGGAGGDTLSLRGIDNRVYYWHEADDPSTYRDFTGCGNSVDANSPPALQLIMDSLRYWVEELHVDGFRFDLAVTTARNADGDFDPRGTFLAAVHQDPVLRQVKLIAEPWDLGMGGYRIGGFPPPWSEWNGQFRDVVRDFWAGTPVGVAALASRLAGSSDLFPSPGRGPWSSVNLITAHDGFTLRDLVSYDEKHNEANREENRDGESHNRSWNCGVEGPTDDPAVLVLRARQSRNLLGTLLLSAGPPMILAGDEQGRTQGGNNNAYCQDNAISWVDWEVEGDGAALREWTASVIALRDRFPVLLDCGDATDIVWYDERGAIMDEAAWNDDERRVLQMARHDGEGGALLLLLNASGEDVRLTLPPADWPRAWRRLIDTSAAGDVLSHRPVRSTRPYALGARSLVLLHGVG